MNDGRDRRSRSGRRSSPDYRKEEIGPLNPLDELAEIHRGIDQKKIFDKEQCLEVEDEINKMVELANQNHFKSATVDRAPLRVKYFFGEGYTYGDQLEKKGPGQERLLPKGTVDPIPDWILPLVVKPLIKAKLIPSEEWANMVVINDYLPGGCIVSHIDPFHLFERPIITCNFFSDSALSFGCRFTFKPIRVSKPTLCLPLRRGVATEMKGYAADSITHCVRPQDVVARRAVIILRRVRDDAPRLLESQIKSSQAPVIHPLREYVRGNERHTTNSNRSHSESRHPRQSWSRRHPQRNFPNSPRSSSDSEDSDRREQVERRGNNRVRVPLPNLASSHSKPSRKISLDESRRVVINITDLPSNPTGASSPPSRIVLPKKEGASKEKNGLNQPTGTVVRAGASGSRVVVRSAEAVSGTESSKIPHDSGLSTISGERPQARSAESASEPKENGKRREKGDGGDAGGDSNAPDSTDRRFVKRKRNFQSNDGSPKSCDGSSDGESEDKKQVEKSSGRSRKKSSKTHKLSSDPIDSKKKRHS